MNGAPGRENSFQSLLRRSCVGSRFFSISSNASGFTLPAAWLPALNALNLFFPRALSSASAMMLRAGFGRWGSDCRCGAAASRRFAAQRVAINWNRVEGMERLPGNPLRIGYPVLVGTRVAALCIRLVECDNLGRCHLLTQCGQFGLRLYLHPEMIDTGLEPSLRNREIDSWVVQHPFRIVRLEHCRRRSEHGRVELDASIEIVHRDVHVKTFHNYLLVRWGFCLGGQQRPRSVSTTVRHAWGMPLQQFCVRKVMSSAMR